MTAKAARLDRLMNNLMKDSESYEGKMSEDAGRLWRNYIHPYRRRVYAALLFTVLWSLHPYLTAMLSRFLVDHVLMLGSGLDPSVIPERLYLFRRYVVLLFAVWAVFVLSHWMRSRLILDIGQKLVFTVRKELHEKLQNLHVGYFEKHETGKIMSRILEDVWVIREWSTNQLLNVASHILRLFLGIGVLLFLNWRLTLIILLSLPFYSWSFVKIRPIVRRLQIALRRLNASMYGLSQERFAGVAVVKAFSKEEHEYHTFTRRVNNNIRLSMRIILMQGTVGLIAGLITAMVTGAIIYIAVSQVRSGLMTLGDTMVFIYALPNIYQQVNALSTIYVTIQAVFVVLKRIFNLLDVPEDVIPGTVQLDGMKGTVDFNMVTFAYPGVERPTIHDITLSVPQGARVALMGPSGAGKSSIFQLLCRFYDPTSGTIHVGGVDVREADPRSLRRHVVMVQQEPVIFSGTVAENIAYGNPDATPEKIMRAARQAELHDFIMSLPVKYETEVGQNGVSLSGGQKQRLALATALLTNPEILLLDDTTSALDAETEARIRATLNRVLANRTSLIITQRIATAKDCDLIFVLENGRLVQSGTHDRLSREEGFYRKIFLQQDSL